MKAFDEKGSILVISVLFVLAISLLVLSSLNKVLVNRKIINNFSSYIQLTQAVSYALNQAENHFATSLTSEENFSNIFITYKCYQLSYNIQKKPNKPVCTFPKNELGYFYKITVRAVHQEENMLVEAYYLKAWGEKCGEALRHLREGRLSWRLVESQS